ncbi:zinc finger protein RFP-like isoform X2 [Hemicordylus capensis]|uniref:zinc finger protein RFP-like isoform X2 n=1 Tax=Hemicordylus capensis TaxID=884348 RepID=UPI002302E8F3|nr:zinc finger protein RFP-like isoform X2 [Hemicordylus capensis]
MMFSDEAAVKLQGELSCSICLEYFSDPVSIHCGHNFCHACITKYWDLMKKKAFPCPRCRETSRKKILKPNRELKNIGEIVPMLNVKERGERMCKRHQEPLKLFCKDDQTPICVVCDKSKEHQDHMVLPMEEAAQDYKKQIQDQLQHMKQQKETLLGFRDMDAARSKESVETIIFEIQKTTSAFKHIQQLLTQQKHLLLAEWKSLQMTTVKRQEEHTSKFSEDVAHLDSLIAEAEERCQQPPTEFLQDVKSTLTRFKKRKFEGSMKTSSELEQSLDSLIRKNIAVAETLQKCEDTLSEIDRGQWESLVDSGTATSSKADRTGSALQKRSAELVLCTSLVATLTVITAFQEHLVSAITVINLQKNCTFPNNIYKILCHLK